MGLNEKQLNMPDVKKAMEQPVNPLWFVDDEYTHEVDLGERIAVYAFNETGGYVVATEKCDGNFSVRVPLALLRQRVASLQRLLAYAERKEASKDISGSESHSLDDDGPDDNPDPF